MVNFIIYEDKKTVRDNYEKLIHKFMGNNDTAYKIYQFSDYTLGLKELIKKSTGHNIYILDIEVPGKSGLDLAREIRSNGDMDSQLIIATAHRELLVNSFINRSLILNFISKFDNCEGNLISAITNAYTNITRHKSFVFKTDGEVYRVPYNDILYFAIEPGNGHICLYTKDKTFCVKKSISNVLQQLPDARFMKTHKSCIVNLYNIESIDLSELEIHFYGGQSTYLLSRNYKKELQQRLCK